MAMSVALDDDYEDWYMYSGMKRERQHLFWMAPFLAGWTDCTQCNTFAKLEADFLRVSIMRNITILSNKLLCIPPSLLPPLK